MNDSMDFTTIKRKSIEGVLALTSRTFILQVIAFVATFLLTILLTPGVFGIFYVVSAIISFLSYFSDIGLAASLIQKKESPTDTDLVTTFTIQQVLVGIMVIGSYTFSSSIAQFYRLDVSGLWLLRSLLIAFFLSSLKTIPSIILERELAFHKLVIPQILETLGFYVVAVVLAARGFGVQSFSWAVLVRAAIGTISLYMIAPWRMRLGFDRAVAHRLLKFGIPFQINSLLALLKDDLLTVYLGKILPFAEVGYIGWAKKWAEVPLRLIMDSVVRVTFPAYSRLQSSKELLGRAIEKTIFALSATIFPITITMIFVIRPFVSLVPRYGKWEPALFSFYLFAFASAIAAISTPLTNAINAIGKIKVTLRLMVMWTSLTWVLTTMFVWWIGFNGVAVSLACISSTIVVVISEAKKYATFSFFPSLRGPLFASMIQGVLLYSSSFLALTTPVLLIIVAGVGVFAYLMILVLIDKHNVTNFIHTVVKRT